MTSPFALRRATVASVILVAGRVAGEDALPQLSAARAASLSSCGQLATGFQSSNTTITSAEPIASGTLNWGDRIIGAHCLVRGELFRRISQQDGKSYAIRFEMRLPNAWNGHLFYQANGGIDGAVSPALGGGGPMPTTALQ